MSRLPYPAPRAERNKAEMNTMLRSSCIHCAVAAILPWVERAWEAVGAGAADSTGRFRTLTTQGYEG